MFAVFETQRLIVRVGFIDGADNNSSLMADILPRNTSTFVGTFTVLEIYVKSTGRFPALLAKRLLPPRMNSDRSLSDILLTRRFFTALNTIVYTAPSADLTIPCCLISDTLNPFVHHRVNA